MADTLTPGARGVPRLVTWAGPVVGLAVALVMVAPVFGGRPPAGEDVMAHLVRADFAIPELVARGRLDGWFPRFVLGHQEFLFNGPGLVWLMALLRALTLGALSNTGALKAVSVGSFVAMVPALWFLARSFGLSPPTAGLAAVLAPCVSNPFGPGLQGLFRVGLISHQVGAVLFCVALGCCIRILGDPRPRWRWTGAAALAGLAVTHLLSVLVLAIVLPLCLLALGACRALSWPGLGRLSVAGASAAGLAGFWLVPFMAHRDLRGVVTTWGTPPLGERLADIASGEILLPTGLGAFAAVGWVFLILRRHPPGVALAVVPLAYLVVAHGWLRLAGGNEVTLQLSNRGLGYVGLLAMMAVAALAAGVTARLGVTGHLIVLAAAAGLVLADTPGRDAAGQFAEPVPQMRQAAATLARLVPDGARFATQRDYPMEIARTGVIHPETWLARASGRNSLNGFNLESSSTPSAAFAADRLDESGPRTSARRMSRFGVTHVVTTTDALYDQLGASGGFVPVWRAPPLGILEVVAGSGQPGPATLLTSDRPLSAGLTDARAEHLAMTLRAPEPARVTVALAWSPKWHARINGEAVALRRASDGLATLSVPAGTSELRLDYRGDAWDRLGLAVSVLTLLAAALAAARRHPMSRSFSRTA